MGIYFELVIKSPSFTHSGVEKELAQEFAMWVRNIQLAAFALLVALGTACTRDGDRIVDKGFFQGYSGVTWCVIFLEAFGGIMVALVIKYTDNILKNFATAISIISSTVISSFFMDFEVTPVFVFGAFAVVCAIALYQRNPPTATNACPISGLCQKRASTA